MNKGGGREGRWKWGRKEGGKQGRRKEKKGKYICLDINFLLFISSILCLWLFLYRLLKIQIYSLDSSHYMFSSLHVTGFNYHLYTDDSYTYCFCPTISSGFEVFLFNFQFDSSCGVSQKQMQPAQTKSISHPLLLSPQMGHFPMCPIYF